MTEIYALSETEIKAQFYDLDPMNVVWHGNYARYFEQARCDLLDSIGYNYQEMEASGYVWPVVDMHVRYLRPITLGQSFIVRSELVEYEFRLKILYTIFDKNSGEKICKAHTEQVAVDVKTNEMQYGTPLILAKKLGIDT